MSKVETNELLTVAQAAQLRGTSRQAMNYLLREGKIPFVEIAGIRFVEKHVLLSYEPDKGGRPPKAAKSQSKQKTSKTTKQNTKNK